MSREPIALFVALRLPGIGLSNRDQITKMAAAVLRREQEGSCHDKADQAFGYPWLFGARGCGRDRASLYRQRRRKDRNGVVDPGLRAGRGHLDQEDRR